MRSKIDIKAAIVGFIYFFLKLILVLSADIIYWPGFAVALGAAMVASQGAISATFQLVNQALALGCFPRVKVVHTSRRSLNQIYIPEINWLLMVICVSVTAGFSDYTDIANACGKQRLYFLFNLIIFQ